MFIEKVCKTKCELHNEIISLNQHIEKLETLAYQLRLLTHNYTLTYTLIYIEKSIRYS